MNRLFVAIGIVSILCGVVPLVRPEIGIRFRNEWTGLLLRPFLHGRVLGSEAREEDSLQRLHSRAVGVLFTLVGLIFLVDGIVE